MAQPARSGASAAIAAAERALPSGPVTVTKAWIEMIHRYLAMTVGALILALNVMLWRARAGARPLRRCGRLRRWCGCWCRALFGKYTVTLRLYPAVVTAHLLGGMVLLALLMAQLRVAAPALAAIARPRAAAAWVLALVAVQIALGGWVSSNYAVLACRGFPQCNGQWWPRG